MSSLSSHIDNVDLEVDGSVKRFRRFRQSTKATDDGKHDAHEHDPLRRETSVQLGQHTPGGSEKQMYDADYANSLPQPSSSTTTKAWKVLSAQVVPPSSFDEPRHFYPRVLNAHLHPMVGAFQRLGNVRIASRYCHLNPKVDEKKLLAVLNQGSSLFRWSGADLFNVTNLSGNRQMIVIETNSSPSGQKSMPLPVDSEEQQDGYHKLMKHCFFPNVAEHASTLPTGALAVIYDKNDMEALGYASAMATIGEEDVYACKYYSEDPNPPIRWFNKVMHVRMPRPQPAAPLTPPHSSSSTSTASASSSPSLSSKSLSPVLPMREHVCRYAVVHAEGDDWVPIRAAFRYVTQRPWSRIPLSSRTLIMNPVIACLAGGRNKMAADKAYEFFNKEIVDSGLAVRVPETIRDVSKEEVPLWVKSMGGKAVVKVPYSNAGQGVFTILNEDELNAFMAMDSRYDKYIVQSLVGHSNWSSNTHKGTYYHTGTIPNAKNKSYVADLRMMICSTPQGYMPLAVYARRAEMPLEAKLENTCDSWQMLGTNLSIKKEDGGWDTDTNRLLLMDSKDFNKLGLGTDDLIDAYVQTVLATTAIDKLSQRMINDKGDFDFDLFASLNADVALLEEIVL